MNNSSAYNNVLLKPSVPTQTAQSSGSKHIYQDDQTTSFQQSFKDAQDSARTQDEKIAKPVATKKAAHAENRKSSNDVGKEAPASVKQAEESRSKDQLAESNTPSESNTASESNTNSESNTQGQETRSNQNSDSETMPDTDIEVKSANTEIAVEEVALDSLTEQLTTETLIPDPFPVDVVAVATSPATPLAEVTTASSFLATATAIPSESSTEPTTVLNPINAAINEAVPDSITNLFAQADTPSLAADEKSVKGDTDKTIASQLEADLLKPQADNTAATPDAAGQAPAIMAAFGANLLPKSVANPSTPTVVSDETVLNPVSNQPASPLALVDSVSEADASKLLASSIVIEKTSTQTVPVVSGSEMSVITDDATEQTQGGDPKSTFEKTLQNLARPEAIMRDESATASPGSSPTNSTSSTTNNALDSMMRFSDSQAPAARSFVVQTAVPVPVGQPQWSQAVGEKVLWLAAQNVSSAEIHLNPENLGPVQVKVSVNQEQTSVNFTSHHAAVREVLDQNLGRLRDMFSEQGLNLVNVDVSDKSFSRQQGDAKDQKGQASNPDVASEEETQVAVSAIVQKRLVDHYA